MTATTLIHALEKTGRRSSGYNGDHGKITHGVPNGRGKALCGTEPQGAGDWSAWKSEAVTCPKCLKKMDKLGVQLVEPERIEPNPFYKKSVIG